MAEQKPNPKASDIAAMVNGPVDWPEYFADSVQFEANPYSVNLIFGINRGEQPNTNMVSVRMSPQHALVMTQLLRKNLKEYEAKVGKIQLPDAMYEGLEIDKEL